MPGDVPAVGKETILKQYAEARAGRPTEMTRAAELFMRCIKTVLRQLATKEFGMVISKVFQVHSIRSVLNAKLKIKSN